MFLKQCLHLGVLACFLRPLSDPPPRGRRHRPVAASSPPVAWAPLSGPLPCRRRRNVAARRPGSVVGSTA
eukprot:3594010-Pyramimonas_sp.AAC.1